MGNANTHGGLSALVFVDFDQAGDAFDIGCGKSCGRCEQGRDTRESDPKRLLFQKNSNHR